MPASVASSLKAAGGMDALVRSLPSDARLREDAEQHQSLADRTRLKIMWALREMDLCPCVLKVVAGIPDSKLSYHLRILESGGLVKVRKRGTWRIYSITVKGARCLSFDESD